METFVTERVIVIQSNNYEETGGWWALVPFANTRRSQKVGCFFSPLAGTFSEPVTWGRLDSLPNQGPRFHCLLVGGRSCTQHWTFCWQCSMWQNRTFPSAHGYHGDDSYLQVSYFSISCFIFEANYTIFIQLSIDVLLNLSPCDIHWMLTLKEGGDRWKSEQTCMCIICGLSCPRLRRKNSHPSQCSLRKLHTYIPCQREGWFWFRRCVLVPTSDRIHLVSAVQMLAVASAGVWKWQRGNCCKAPTLAAAAKHKQEIIYTTLFLCTYIAKSPIRVHGEFDRWWLRCCGASDMYMLSGMVWLLQESPSSLVS